MIAKIHPNDVLLKPVHDGIRISLNGISYDRLMSKEDMVFFAYRLLQEALDGTFVVPKPANE